MTDYDDAKRLYERDQLIDASRLEMILMKHCWNL